MVLLGVFAGLATFLAAVGIYGVMSYGVAQRVHEIGIRMALGAQPRDVLRLVVREGLRLTLLGSLIGGAASIVAARWIASDLYGVKAWDPLTLSGVMALLVAVALVACYVPARRATRADPHDGVEVPMTSSAETREDAGQNGIVSGKQISHVHPKTTASEFSSPTIRPMYAKLCACC